VCLAIGFRPDEPGSDAEALAAFAADPIARPLRLRPLTDDGAATLLARWLPGADSAREFSTTCRRATGGNPLLLRELATALAQDGVEPGREAAVRVGSLAPRAISRFVLLRIGNLDPCAARVASAAAVLGDGAELRHVAALAGLELDEASAAADVLARVEVLERGRPLCFVHPIVREAVYADLPAGARAAAHGDAAALLAAEGAGADSVAAHVMVTEAAGRPEVVETLCEAAGLARDRGASETATRYMRRALAEPPPAEQRPALLATLGEVELLSGQAAAALEHLEQSMAQAPPGAERARRAHLLARAALSGADFDAALRLFEEALAASETEPDMAGEIEAEMASLAWQDPRWVEPMRERAARWEQLPGDSRAELALLACAGRLAVTTGRRAGDAQALLRRALAGEVLLRGSGPTSVAFYTGVYALMLTDAFDEAADALARAEALAREHGDVIALLPVSLLRSMCALRRGRPRDAEADALQAIGATEATMLHPLAAPAMIAVLAESQVEQGRVEDAAATIARSGMDGEMPAIASFNRLLHARAIVRLAQGDAEAALADALAVGGRDEPTGLLNPWVAWRTTAAAAYQRLGRERDARAVAEEWVELAEGLGVASPLGEALRSAARVASGARRVELLERSVDVLEGAPARGELAASLCDLGAALRSGGQRRAALERLREAHDIALEGGALALHQRVLDELRAAGARPRARMHSGVDALTASERRVAAMAADGHSNKDIAQALFVTAKTVENHLGRVYPKLQIHSRAELREALATG
jgi:DNA-binding CsgD family transcriptional regulator